MMENTVLILDSFISNNEKFAFINNYFKTIVNGFEEFICDSDTATLISFPKSSGIDVLNSQKAFHELQNEFDREIKNLRMQSQILSNQTSISTRDIKRLQHKINKSINTYYRDRRFKDILQSYENFNLQFMKLANLWLIQIKIKCLENEIQKTH